MSTLTALGYKKAIVTGGAGFIGSHLVDHLLSDGLEVVSIDNYATGKQSNLDAAKTNNRFTEVRCDVTDYDELRKHFSGTDIVFHEAASKKTVCLKDPRLDLEVNGKGAFNILELSRDFGVRKVVHASTGSVYGEAERLPQDENHPLSPKSYYGVSKLAGERYAKVFEVLYGLDVTILRYFHVYGPRQDFSSEGGVVSIFCHNLLNGRAPVIHGDGTQLRSFTYVEDVVRANLLVAVHPETKGECYNCASGVKITVKELADLALKLFNSQDLKIAYDDWTMGDIRVFDIDNKKLTNLGFAFATPFEVGLQKTIDWFRVRR